MKNDPEKSKQYEDMLYLPRHQSSHRLPMPIKDRAAQFAPFAAVVGHDMALKEAARLTEERKDLDEMEKRRLNDLLHDISNSLPCEVELVYFEQDSKKRGGHYRRILGLLSKIDLEARRIHFQEGIEVALDELYSIKKTSS